MKKQEEIMTITECGYCDNPLPPKNFDGDLVCSRCGAEWADSKHEREMTKSEIEEMESYENEF